MCDKDADPISTRTKAREMMMMMMIIRGGAVAQWLTCWATDREVARSNLGKATDLQRWRQEGHPAIILRAPVRSDQYRLIDNN